MPIEFKDRVPGKLGRVRVIPENGSTPYYAVIERADEPVVAGTPINAASMNAAQETLVYSTATGTSTWKRVYVGPNGKDTNTGASTSVPMATIKGAIRKYAKWHKTMDIYLMDGTYTEDVVGIATDQCGVSIRSVSEDKDKVIINSATELECHINLLRLYNITLNMTADNLRTVTVNGGMLFAYNVRFSVPATSNASCVNVYNGASALLVNCVINAGTGSAVYGNQGLHIRAMTCTSERTVGKGCHAHNGTIIEYTPTFTATVMAQESGGGKCIPLDARAGSILGTVAGQSGQYCTYDGLLVQWGMTTITPSAANTPTSKTVTYKFPFATTPAVFLNVIDKTPQQCDVGVQYTGIDAKTEASIVLSRTGTTLTQISWLAIGKKG